MSVRSTRAAWISAATIVVAAGGIGVAPSAGAAIGPETTSDSYAFAAKLSIGDSGACSGALVDPQWVLTAASCFAADGKPAQAGKPAAKTTVTVGRTSLTQTGGSVVDAVELVPRTDRDVVMVKLAQRVMDPKVKPVRIAANPAATSETLTSVGFGRTKTEWAPDKLHSSAFTVASVDTKSVGLNGSDNAVMCQGDAGAPALRDNNGTPELVALNSLSWQGGCLDNDPAETRTGAVDTRVDDLGDWIRQTAFRVQDDFTNDGIADLASIWDDGTLHIYPGDKTKGLTGGQALQVGGTSWKSMKQLAKGDFTNDGIADLMAIWVDGTLHLYKGDGKGNITGATTVTLGGKGWDTIKQLTAGDYTGDGIADLMAVWSDGTLHLYKGKGDGQIEPQVKVTVGANTWDTVKLLPGGDFNGDGIADLMAVWSDGTLHYYKGTGDGQIANGTTVPLGGNNWDTVRQMTGGDFNGDGIADLMAVWTDGTLHLYKGDGKGSITGATTMWGGTTWKTVLQFA
ncbi:FG-GAP-like repeat-containing protein [Streptomyces sp. NPDC056085]